MYMLILLFCATVSQIEILPSVELCIPSVHILYRVYNHWATCMPEICLVLIFQSPILPENNGSHG